MDHQHNIEARRLLAALAEAELSQPKALHALLDKYELKQPQTLSKIIAQATQADGTINPNSIEQQLMQMAQQVELKVSADTVVAIAHELAQSAINDPSFITLTRRARQGGHNGGS